MRRQDWIITAGVLILAGFMPMAIGGALPVARIAGEVLVCLLLLEWAAEMRRAPLFPARSGAAKLMLPVAALAGYVLFQLAPLPPQVLRVVSPTAYEVYARAFPDWPRQRPYADLNAMVEATPKTTAASDSFVILPTTAEVKAGAAIPFAPAPGDSGAFTTGAANLSSGASGGLQAQFLKIYESRWRPLTLCPPLTWGALLMFATSAGLFLMVGFFPIGSGDPEAEASFRRTLALGLLAIGAAIAILGLIEQATFNGRILWTYVPLDWGAPRLVDTPRASGPFVNPDHFAGYLAAIFPLALAGALYPKALFPGKWSTGFRIASASLGFMIFLAVLTSQSRAGWISIAVATTLVAALSIQAPAPAKKGAPGGGWGYLRPVRIALGVLTVLLVLGAIFLGASGVEDTSVRVDTTFSQVGNVGGRIDTWKAALLMVRDFWLTGVGLAAWPEIFARYALAPWSPNFYYATENDYLQFFAETGVVGLLLAGWLVYAIATRLSSGLQRLSSSTRSIEAALIAGLSVIAVVEFFDFDLQIPAIAFTFAILLGLAVRLAAGDEESGAGPEPQPARPSMLAGWTAAAALVLLVACLWQPLQSYPYNLVNPVSLADGRRRLILYPANPHSHSQLVSLIGERMEPSAKQRELETAVWLDPANPTPRDALAELLEGDDKVTEELAEIKTSVFNSPSDTTHPYLASRVVPWLSPAMQVAIKIGYQRAVAANFGGALEHLGVFYEQTGQYYDEAAMYEHAAGLTGDPDAQYRLLVAAGHAYALAGNMDDAQKQLHAAVALEPDNPVAYQTLIGEVFARSDNFDAMKQTVKEAIGNEVDGYDMWSAMASTTAQMGKTKVAEDAVRQALLLRPGSVEDVIRLGNLFLAGGDSDSAVREMEKAVDMRPNSAVAYYSLARAEEAAYEYADADNDYRRAIQLAPHEASYKASYQTFKNRMDKAEAAAAAQHASDPAQ
ncbi:MAG: O-antigen ligase family protein [Candidatus Binatus sp.]